MSTPVGYCTVEDIQQRVKQDTLTTDQTKLLGNIIRAAEDLIKNYCQTSFGETPTKTEFFEAYDYQVDLWVSKFPLASVTSIKFAGNLLVEDSNYFVYLEEGLIKFVKGTVWEITTQHKNIEVIYTYGYTDVPDGLRQAAVEMVSNLWDDYRRAANIDGAMRMEMADIKVQFAKRGMMTDDIKTMLQPYRRRMAATGV